jgi:tetratricopeptide (TPR) repeat protein
LRAELAGWRPVDPGDLVWRLYLLGLLDERLGDPIGAEEIASELDVLAVDLATDDGGHGRGSGAMAEDLALYLRARLAAGTRRYDEALRLLEKTAPHRWWPVMDGRAYLKQPYERWLTAEVLAALGRPEDALNWLAGLGMEGERSYMGIRHFRMAEIYEELGDRKEAKYHYERFVTYWRGADAELQPRVEAARRRIEALSAQR